MLKEMKQNIKKHFKDVDLIVASIMDSPVATFAVRTENGEKNHRMFLVSVLNYDNLQFISSTLINIFKLEFKIRRLKTLITPTV